MIKISQENDKVLVTGGSGYIGSTLVLSLLKKRLSVRVIDIAPFHTPVPSIYQKRFEFIQSDFRQIEDSHLQDVFAIIHLAAFSDEASANLDPVETKAVNTDATIALAKKAKGIGVKRFIFASSSSLYDLGIDQENGAKSEDDAIFPTGNYSTSKHQAEIGLLEVMDKDFFVVILRKGTVFGYSPTMRFDLVVNAMIKKALTGGIIKVFCRGLQWRPLLSVDYAAAAYYCALKAPASKISGQIFNIAYDNFLVKDIAKIVQSTLATQFATQSEIVFEHDDRKDRSYRINTQKARDVLGFTAQLPFKEAIIRLAKHVQEKVA